MKYESALVLCLSLFHLLQLCKAVYIQTLLFPKVFPISLKVSYQTNSCLILIYTSQHTQHTLSHIQKSNIFFLWIFGRLTNSKSVICSQCDGIITYFSFRSLDLVQILEYGIRTKKFSPSGGLQIIIFFYLYCHYISLQIHKYVRINIHYFMPSLSVQYIYNM